MYALYNRALNRFLKHPKDGIWATDNLDEAKKLLDYSKEYVSAIGVPEMSENLTIMEISTEQLDGEKLPEMLI